MLSPHTYGAESRTRYVTLTWIALSSLFLTLLGLFVLRIIFEWPPLQPFKPYTWPVSPITMTGSFALLYGLYDRVLWKFWSKTPDLSGTWVGVVEPNYQTWPHLEVITIHQTWSEILVQGEVFWKSSANGEWSLKQVLGNYKSLAVGMSELLNNRATFVVTYFHTGSHLQQPNFPGSLFLDFNSIDETLTGRYFTLRLPNQGKQQGSLGPVRLKRVTRVPTELPWWRRCFMFLRPFRWWRDEISNQEALDLIGRDLNDMEKQISIDAQPLRQTIQTTNG